MSETQKHTKPNVPNLRFPGFEGEWESCELGEIAEFSKGAGISKDQRSSDGNPCILYGELYTTYLTEIIDDVVSKTNLDPTGLVRSKANDIIIPASGETAIDISTARCVLQDDVLLGGDLNIIRLFNQDGRFFSYQLNGVRKKDIARIAHGVSIVHLHGNALSHITVNYPSRSEQEKISSLLSLIDQRIAIQNKVIEKLKSLIRELNNKLMDNPLWNKVYLGDFMQFYSTNSLSWEQLSYESGRMKNLHYGLIHIGLPTMTDCKDNTLPYIQAPFIPKQFTICKDGDIAFADASEDTEEVGKAIELYNTGSMDVVCGLHTIHGRDIMGLTVVGFKGFAVNSKYFHDQLRRLAQGSKVYSITAENIKNCYIYVPEVTEQSRIVGLLLCLQDKIKCAERELNSYEMQKQFMLSEMLV